MTSHVGRYSVISAKYIICQIRIYHVHKSELTLPHKSLGYVSASIHFFLGELSFNMSKSIF